MTFETATSATRRSDGPGNLTLRQQLREMTAAAHRRVDALFAQLNLSQLPDYRRFLEANAAALLPLEDALVRARVADLFPDWPHRRRRLAILDDLHNLQGHIDTLPAVGPFGFSDVLGTMYVLEGSRLGGKVLLSTVTKSSDQRILGATKYLRHGADSHLWTSFLAALEQHGASLDNIEDAIDSALRAFELFELAAEKIGLKPPPR